MSFGGVKAELSSVVPLALAFILNTKEALSATPAPLNLTPTCTAFTVSSDAKAAGVSSIFQTSILSLLL